jgi:hypothetical protein
LILDVIEKSPRSSQSREIKEQLIQKPWGGIF